MWAPYEDDKLVVSPAVCISKIDTWTKAVALVF
jgi:hypothetical protein